MTTVNVYEAKTQLSKLLEMVERGESVTIARAGRPIADLVPHVKVDLVFGSLQGQIRWDPDTFDDEDPGVLELFGLR